MSLLLASSWGRFSAVTALLLFTALGWSDVADTGDDILRSSPAGAKQLTCNPASLNFSRVGVGKPETWSVTMTNAGSTSVTVSTMKANAPEFSIIHLTLPLTLPPGQSIGFNVIFAPTEMGPVKGTFAFSSNASNSILYLAVSGTGVTNWALKANPPNLQFGSVLLGASAALPVALTNAGSSSITITQDAATGAGFSFSGLQLPLTLKAGQSFTFNVKFMPRGKGSVSGGMLVSNVGDPILMIPLSGAGRQPTVSLSWTASNSPVVGYNIYRSTGGSYARINSALDPSTTYVDSSVQPGNTYYYATTAVDSSGVQSVPSNQVQVEIP